MAKKIKPGHYYPDISNEFEMARINYGLFDKKGDHFIEKDGSKMLLKDFDPTVQSSLINNVAAGRATSKHLRSRIVKFTTEWYWDFNQKTEKPNE